jgi:hypothetical protein
MVQKHRILTNVGKDKLVTVELQQKFDLLEILSLKFTQQDTYASLCADYGVVCGRISVNNGFGVPNARVSIFVPLAKEDEDDPVISALYPFKSPQDKNDSGYRYNLLPARKQHGGHEPTGTFPDQTDILTREEVLEVYEKYYKYTVKTNTSGDFMIWGVPLGEQTIHVDVDLSDIGCFSLRPDDFLRNGYGVDQFKTTYQFKPSVDLDSLPQVISFDRTVEVHPFWGNVELCTLGITRTDFDLSNQGVKIQPKAFVIGGFYTDKDSNAINKNCYPRRQMGRKCDLITTNSTIEAIRFTTQRDSSNRPILELIETTEDIDQDGAFVMPIEMNMDYVYTNEFGENEFTNDPNKGIPTSAIYRLRASVKNETLGRVRTTASYLLPNIKEYSNDQTKSYAWSTDYSDYPASAMGDILNNVDGFYYPQDFFYRFSYNKVYTVSSFQSSYFMNVPFSSNNFLAIKEIVPAEEEDCTSSANTFPVNFGSKNFTFTLLIADVLLFLEHLINLLVLTFTNSLVRLLFSVGDAADFRPIRKLARSIKRAAYRAQENGQRRLYLINYPECEECNGDNSYGAVTTGSGSGSDYCSVGSVTITGDYLENSRTLSVTSLTFSPSTTGNCSGEDLDALGAALISGGTGILYFINNQSNYQLSSVTYGNVHITNEFSGTPVLDISGNTISYSNITFEDLSGSLGEPISYTLTIRSKTEKEGADTSSLVQLESGCDLYDTPYDESIVSWYYPTTGYTNYTQTGVISPSSYNAGTTSVVATNITNTGYGAPLDAYTSTLSDDVVFYPSSGVPLVSSFEGETYEKYTRSGMSEFENGIFTVVPGTQSTRRVWEILKEYRRRKRVGKLFCGGIVNYSFVDNWLSGSLYFFAFKAKNKSATDADYCKDIIKWVPDQNLFYYRSCPYNPSTGAWGAGASLFFTKKRINRPTTFVDLGPRDEFIKEICTDPNLDPNCSVSRQIGPTSYKSFGELLGLAINYRMDVSNNDHDINQFFDNEGFNLNGISRVLDGDIMQLISINSEVGIEPFDLQSPKYLGYSYQVLDPDVYPSVFKNGTSVYGPLPVTFEFAEDGERQRACLNEPTHIANDGLTLVQGRLTESAQPVPFYLWEKGGTGFGPYDQTQLDNQHWNYGSVQVQPLQGMTYGYNLTSAADDSSDKYLLLPMTYTFSGLTIGGLNVTTTVEFDVVSSSDGHASYDGEYPGFTYLYYTSGTQIEPTAGTLYTRYGAAGTWHQVTWDASMDFIIRKTQDYYSGTKQILSTPFLFYFGLRPGKTGLDKFIERFGPKGAFPSAE